MSGPRLRSSFAAALLTVALATPAAASTGGIQFDYFPKANEVFPRLIAEPRHTQISASYYRHQGRDASDLALGHSWGMMRWRTGLEGQWLWQWDLEGMAYSRFLISGGVNEFETADFLAALPVTLRRGDISFKGSIFHKSSHLGDDRIRRTGLSGFRYSTEGLRAQAAIEPCRFARVYAGAEYLLHTVPSPDRWSLQSGLELTSDDLHWSRTATTRLFLAQDLQTHQRVGWNVDCHTMAGVKIGRPRSTSRALRVSAGYFTGHSSFGQFYAEREHRADLSVSFEL